MPFRKTIVHCGVVFLAAVMVWVPTCVQAEMLGTQQTLQSLSNTDEKREWLSAVIHRQEAKTQLQKIGVSQSEALNRVNSMTDEEVASAINQIEQYAGAGDPLWKGEGEKDWGYFFMIVVVLIVMGCVSFCWLLFI